MRERLIYKIAVLSLRVRKAEKEAKEYKERYTKLSRKYWKLFDEIDDLKWGDNTIHDYLIKHSKLPED